MTIYKNKKDRGTFRERKIERQFWDIIHGLPKLSIVKIKREIEKDREREGREKERDRIKLGLLEICKMKI